LENQNLIVSRFLAEEIKTRLRTVSDKDLRLIINKFHAYPALRIWAPKDDNEPPVVIGDTLKNATVKKARLGRFMKSNTY
jgi:hypothetical protein